MNYDNYWNDMGINNFEHYNSLYSRVRNKLIVKNNSNVIDVGGGHGGLMEYLNISKADILDISDSGLEKTNEKYTTIKEDILKLKNFDKKYDVAYCFEVAEHLAYPNNLFKNINKLLNSGGILFLSIPNNKPDGVHHVKQWKMEELINDLFMAGFIIEWINNNPKFYPIAARPGKNIKSIGIWCVGKIIPLTIRNTLCYNFPNIFSSMFILKVSKVSDVSG